MPDPVTDARGAPPVDVEVIEKSLDLWRRWGSDPHEPILSNDQILSVLAELDRLRQANDVLEVEATHEEELRAELLAENQALQRRLAALTRARLTLVDFADPDHWIQNAGGRWVWLGDYPPFERPAADVLALDADAQEHPAKIECDATADDLRRQGWSVAVHNDYRQRGVPHTFWLVTKDGRAVKGEGPRDVDALNQIRQQVRDADAQKQGEAKVTHE